jgi:phosphatidylserine decarboxylase
VSDCNTSADHQYIDRDTKLAVDEFFLSDRHIRWLYSEAREIAPRVFAWLTHSKRLNQLLATINFDKPFSHTGDGLAQIAANLRIDFSELAVALPEKPSWREVFGRKIRYWELRPLPALPQAIVSPCDARLLTGSFAQQQHLQLKGKFFDLSELLDARSTWIRAFGSGDWAVFRLTPEQYHYTHCPVSGVVEDVYEAGSAYHSCNPTANIELVTALSKNRRSITVINTDCPGGSGVGLVAMIEVVALLIGRVRQAYSEHLYRDASPVFLEQTVKRGAVKSEFMPGSSSVVLLFEANRIRFDDDLASNQCRTDVRSRFSSAYGRPLVETQVRVRSQIAVPFPR